MSVPNDLPFPEKDEDIRLMVELAEVHSDRYERQVTEFLDKGDLKVAHGNFSLRYQKAGIGCRISLSSDAENSYRELAEARLVGNYFKDRKTLFWEFAHSEARLIIEEKVII